MIGREYLRIEKVSKTYGSKGNEIVALENIELTVKQGEFVSIIGTSGCGKSTLLRMICGLDTQYTGRILRKGKAVTAPGLECGIVFQEHRLLPWLTVEENIDFALNNHTKAQRKELIKKNLSLVGLAGTESLYPGQLSGGMAQRVSIARALVNRPDILLLDEPFGALDALTRLNMQKEILRIWKKEKMTIILVTHDIEEAVYLGTRLVVMSPRPGTVKREIMFPGDIPKCQTDPAFIRLREEVYHEIVW
ncbi:MAG: ABC transporter ATP-binding protein [Veillonellales bacterium]